MLITNIMRTNNSFSVREEMVLAFIEKETITVVKEFLSKNKEVQAYEKYNMSFRFLRVDENTANLEILIMKDATIGQVIYFFKPVGYYSIEKGWLSSKVTLTITKEFEFELDSLRSKGLINVELKKLSLIENAIIAVFSMESLIIASERADNSFQVNGLYLDIYISDQGNPQFFLDDKYGFSDGIAVFTFGNEQILMDPAINLKSQYDILKKRQLLSVFKAVK